MEELEIPILSKSRVQLNASPEIKEYRSCYELDSIHVPDKSLLTTDLSILHV